MEKRRLGKTGLMVTRIGFGAIKLPQVDPDTCTELLNAALDKGINFVDTAREYGDSEVKIGNAISHRRREFFLCSKSPSVTADEMKRDVESSLTRLKTDYLDLFLQHNLRTPEMFETVTGKRGSLEALKRLKDERVVRHIGFSSHRWLDTMERGVRSGEFEAIMVAYNILNDELTDQTVMPLAKQHDLGVIIMKPLAGGVLAAPPPSVRILSQCSTALPVNATQALRYVLSNDAVDTAIPGMTNLRELEEDYAAGEFVETMSPDEKRKLQAAVEALGKEFCRNCGYCLPCPEGIIIPLILRQEAYLTHYGLDTWARFRYGVVEIKATACKECGTCEEKCPYGLPVIEKLKRAHAILTG